MADWIASLQKPKDSDEQPKNSSPPPFFHPTIEQSQELIVSHISRIELLRPDITTRKVHSILSDDVFGVVHSLAVFRLTGASKGLSFWNTTPQKNVFEKVHQETFGKSGCRRIVPGQYLATDPKSRAVMIGSMEKQRFVYILNRDIAARLTIGSPLEAHKSQTIVQHCTGVDVGFENPIFACLEVDYSDTNQDATGEAFKETEKMLTYYKLDLVLNLVRKWSETVERGCGSFRRNGGSSGALVCSEDYVTYEHIGSATLAVPIPRRENPLEIKDRGILIVSGVVHKMKSDRVRKAICTKSRSTTLVTLNGIKIKYFGTVSVASSLCILKSEFLLVASEFGNQSIISFPRLTADDPYDQYIIVSFSNATLVLSIGEIVEEFTNTGFMATSSTIAVHQLGQDALLQIYPQGIRPTRANKQVTEWRSPGGRQIVRAAINRQQVVIALTGGDLVYFEVNDSGNLSESHVRREMSGNVTCLSIQPLPKDRRRIRFLAVGCDGITVRILSLESSSCLEPLSMQALSGVPESLVMIDMPDQLSEGTFTTLYLNIDLQNGVLLRTVLDQTSGQLSDTRTRFLSRIHLNPLSYDALEYTASFASEQCLEGVVAIAGNELKVFTIEKFDFFSIDQEKKKLERLGFKDEAEEDELDPSVFGHTRSEPGKWASLVRILNPSTGETTFKLDLEHNEAAFSLAVLNFAVDAGVLFLAVGTASDLTLASKSLASGFIHIYKFVNDGLGLEFVHKTAVEDIPHALPSFPRSYLGSRFITLHILIASDNKIVVFANDRAPRWITCSAMIDYDTVAAGDKFGNFFRGSVTPKD
ncbi:MAG: mono-functional DNA-alkylating methyl methanesulfonate N-term-domain-containing protein [Benniella sp.]|nr:MAG: mono-functional DNA-alkylating methyl methanesulfonate N-term-domain-containing protein [Benniella sp.]